MPRNSMVQNGSEDKIEYHLGMDMGFDGWEPALPEYGDQGLCFN